MNDRNYSHVIRRKCQNCGASHTIHGWDRDVRCLCGALVSHLPEWVRRAQERELSAKELAR